MYPVKSLGLRRLAAGALPLSGDGLMSATGVAFTTGVGTGTGASTGAGVGAGNGVVILEAVPLPLPAATILPIPPLNTSNNELPDEEDVDVDEANDLDATTGTDGCDGVATGTATTTAAGADTGAVATTVGGRGGIVALALLSIDSSCDDCTGD